MDEQTTKGVTAGTPPKPNSFEALFTQEDKVLGSAGGDDAFTIANAGHEGEPYVNWTTRDRMGLALSGGGIRSATFNLGLLQSMADLGVLEHVDYLSTVSGGGYIGGFWTKWRHENAKAEAPVFPTVPKNGGANRASEPPEIRHLREFSNFLMPRLGLFQSETWSGIVTVLAGLVPSLLAAAAVLAIVLAVWLLVMSILIHSPEPVRATTLFGIDWLRAVGFPILSAGIFLVAEVFWRLARKADKASRGLAAYSAFTVVGLAVFSVVLYALAPESEPARAQLWRDLVLPGGEFRFSTAFLLPVEAMLAAALALAVVRLLLVRYWEARRDRSHSSALDRTLARCLGIALVFCSLGLVWEGCRWLFASDFRIIGTAGGTAALAAAFAWVRSWLGRPADKKQGQAARPEPKSRFLSLLPSIIAPVLVLGMTLGVGVGLLEILRVWPWGPSCAWLAWLNAAVVVVLLTLVLFDPARCGLHDFYRGRIARCFLGAANPHAKARRIDLQTVEHPEDDLVLERRQAHDQVRTSHLVCCAANDLGGDPLPNLSRDACSATLSVNGIAMGNRFKTLSRLRLSSALTASAAAFNSNMGSFSKNFGRAITFVMSALNLRLGLWLPHPRREKTGRTLFPGLYLFYEMFGRACAKGWSVHLSDGGHFENLALYELVRRHCRYIIASDCGADPRAEFDDLGNAIRRAREDFGVEIELDLAPLRPDVEGNSLQHAVVGTIHYDGIGGVDKGSILYFKPALSGDEPPDVLQYRASSGAFPHEGTADQFFDEAQWESYRRLGEHSGRKVLEFLERQAGGQTAFTDRLFNEARIQWQPMPAAQEEAFRSLLESRSALEAELVSGELVRLQAEIFPEVALAVGPCPDAARKADDGCEELRVLAFLVQAVQAMEEVWLAADMDNNWSHPICEGWMNYLHRWAQAPSFRRWWPVLRPLCSPGFREFAKERLELRIRDTFARKEPEGRGADMSLRVVPDDQIEQFRRGHAWTMRRRHAADPDRWEERRIAKRVFAYEMVLDDERLKGRSIQVGFALVAEDPTGTDGGREAQLDGDDLFVPHALTGGGIVARLLDALIAYYRGTEKAPREFTRLRVRLFQPTAKGKERFPGKAEREKRIRLIEFYKSRGFVYAHAREQFGSLSDLPERHGALELVLELGAPSQAASAGK